MDQQKISELSELDELVILCGHYEGVDQRVLDYWNIEEVSIGDYVLTGGELPAMVLIDSVARLLPDVLGNADSALDESILSALSSITKLGGYMIFFNLLFILPSLLTALLPLSYKQRSCLIGCMGCLLEITGGIGLLENQMPDFVLCVLPFGGLSCIVQTYSMIESADLSLSEYVMHKMILTAVTVVFYFLAEVRFFLPG